MIIKCTCSHKVQDRLHGSRNRVANECKDANGAVKYRCTVCENEHHVSTPGVKS